MQTRPDAETKPPDWGSVALVAQSIMFPRAERSYRADPVGWAETKLGDFLWSKQREVAESVRDHRYTAVPSCHDAGKSFIASRIIRWWLDVHPPGEAFVVWTAPTYAQVNAIIGRELRAIADRGDTPIRVTLSSQAFVGDTLVGYGRKPADYDPSAFQGIHARYVLVVIDEACGVPATIFDAADTLMTNEFARLLAIGNPDDPASQFAKVCDPQSKLSDGWNVIRIDGLATPNFTDEVVPDHIRPLLLSETWVQERKERWGEDSAIYTAKVRGQFPDVSDDTLFSPAMIRAAQACELAGGGWGQLAYDIARMGPDETVGYRNRRGVVRVEYSARKQDTMATTGAIARRLLDLDHHVPAWVDADGLGAGVYDRLVEQRLPVFPWHGGQAPMDGERFVNRRAEAYWHAREEMLAGRVDIDPDDDVLEAQLRQIRFKVDSRGRIAIETKDEMRKRGLKSPDRVDAFVMSLWMAPRLPTSASTGSMQGTRTLTGDLLDRPM